MAFLYRSWNGGVAMLTPGGDKPLPPVMHLIVDHIEDESTQRVPALVDPGFPGFVRLESRLRSSRAVVA
jgi:hypothetical protein